MLRILLLIPILVLSSCAHLDSEIANEPIIKPPSGEVVYVRVANSEGKSINDSPIGLRLRRFSYRWLMQRGFKPTDKLSEAHTGIELFPNTVIRKVIIPARQYTIPIYGNTLGQSNETYTSVVKNDQGTILGTITSERQQASPFQPTGYQSVKEESYLATRQERSIRFIINRVVRDKGAEIMSRGQIYPSKYDMEFFESENRMEDAVVTILEKSPLGAVTSAPASTQILPPGCWATPGFEYQSTESSKLKSLGGNATAMKVGIRVNDEVISFNNMARGSDALEKTIFKVDEIVKVKVRRGKKELEFKIPMVNRCINDV